MKTITLILFSLLLTSASFCQIGLIANDSLLWQQTTYYTTGPSGPGQGPQYFYTYRHYYIKGDSIIGSESYKKLYSYSIFVSTPGYNPPAFNYSSLTFDSFIYEDSNCVYKGTPNSFTKILDYNLQAGDSFSFVGYSPKITLLSIDSVSINGQFYSRYNFDKGIKWIKGIGDVVYGASYGSYGFFNPPPYTWMTLGSQFRCFSENNVPTYGNYCNLPLSIIDNDFNDNINIYPNPTDNELHVISNSNEIRYVIYSIIGFPIKMGVLTNIDVIDVKMLPQGSYLIKFIYKDNISISKLFIKH